MWSVNTFSTFYQYLFSKLLFNKVHYNVLLKLVSYCRYEKLKKYAIQAKLNSERFKGKNGYLNERIEEQIQEYIQYVKEE